MGKDDLFKSLTLVKIFLISYAPLDMVDRKGDDSPHPPGTMVSPRFDRFFRTHEKVMWEFGALDFGAIEKDKLTQNDVDGVRAAMLVESHNPVYTMRILEYFRADHEMTSFVVTWGYEEMKHYVVLRSYLEACGMVNVPELHQELDVTRAGPWGDKETRFTRMQSFVYTMIQEQVTGRFYRRFADFTKEPVLQNILRLVSKDEYRHCQYYLEKGREELDGDRRRLKEVNEVLLDFEMPGSEFMPNYKRDFDAGMKVAPFDIGAMRETVDKIGQLTGKLHLLKLAADPAFHRKLRNELGLDLKKVFAEG